ncbi:FAD binding domain-containing protein [Plectosphaerella plurivora]|uniref:FAD binding domain-containing protein n=1 Tax=Plectosphaerella plurivora TaxID=936078 RepID=A0A9P8VDA8_9PEZI|nr:FAD binding domain-containing protein [Plectosphaerella plurivora]
MGDGEGRHVFSRLVKNDAMFPTPSPPRRGLSRTYHSPALYQKTPHVPDFDETTDVLIVGSGAGALTASLRAARLGLRALVVEKEATLGGASVISGGGLWVPCNPVAAAHGIVDSEKGALAYFEKAVGDVGPASSVEKRQAYLTNGPRMISWLQDEGFKFHFSKGYPDYYPAMEGAFGKDGGRTIESKAFDVKKLGAWQAKLPASDVPLAIYTNDAPLFTRVTSSVAAFATAATKVLPLALRMLRGQKLVSLGRALVAQLLHLNLSANAGAAANVDIRLETSLIRLIESSAGDIVGAELRTLDGLRTVRAERGVILAAGGFARNQKMRERYLPSPATTAWTSSPAGDTGDAIQEGMRVGAATALLDDAWWGPTIIDPITGRVFFALIERARPHCFIVDSSGSRFMNEAQSYTDAGHDQYERNKKVPGGAIPAWLIMDQNHRSKYMLGNLFARQKLSKEMLDTKRIFTAPTLEALAEQIGVDAAGLQKTADCFNTMCDRGVDLDHGRGASEYDQFFGDPANRPNPCLGAVAKAPFYAVPVYPGDLGTKGGLLTDEFQRVVKEDGAPIPGLFAIGNTAASIMGRTYLGAGSTLGPAMTHGYIAVNSM